MSFPDLSIDVYSGGVRAMFERYTRENVCSVRDSTLLMDYRFICQALTHALADDAEEMAHKLDAVLEDEVSYRMNRWRIQADQAANDIRSRLMGYV